MKTFSEIIEIIKENEPFYKEGRDFYNKLTDKEKEVLKEWSIHGSKEIRKRYHDGGKNNTLNEMFNNHKGNNKGTLYRGVRDGSKENKNYIKSLNKLRENDIYSDSAPTSWSKQRRVVDEHIGTFFIRVILIVDGITDEGYNISKASEVPKEQEVIVRDNSQMIVVKSEKEITKNYDMTFITTTITLKKG